MRVDLYDVIVIGGGYAGLTAANRFPSGMRVLLVDPKDEFVHRIRLHEFAAGGRPRVSIPFRRILKSHVKHRIGSAVHVEPGIVRLLDGNELHTRHILVTTGSDQMMQDSIASRLAATRIRQRLAHAQSGSSVVIRGAGLTGIECAAEVAYRRPNLGVHLYGLQAVGAELPHRAREYLRSTLTRLGVVLDHAPPTAQVDIDATGLHRSPLASDSALPTNERGRMRVAATLEAAPGIWGAGDAVLVENQTHLRASCAAAIPMGAHAADNIARTLRGEPPAAFDFGYSYRCISLGRRAGLILAVDEFDVPTGRIVRGTKAALFKATICAAVIHAASSFARSYTWRSTAKFQR